MSCCCSGPGQMIARYIYALMFLATNLIAWMIRDYSEDAVSRLRYFKTCNGSRECVSTEGVLRLSLGSFVFFSIMFVTTVGTSRLDGIRDAWHSGWWGFKFVLWVFTLVSPFFVPTSWIRIYGEVARFGAGFFLFVQLLSVINFIYWWNGKWIRLSNCIPMVSVTFLAYGGAMTAISFMYIWFAPRPSCSLNIFFITWTVILILAMTLLSLHPKVSAGLMTSSLVALYIVFLCWSAIMSEPKSVVCNTRPRQTGKGDAVTVLSFLLAILAIAFATFSTGADTNPFSSELQPEQVNREKLVPYGYGFFHFVFAVGSMYFAMLFIGWNLHQTMHKWSIDVGWASVWVKVTNEWLAALAYVWSMLRSLRKQNSVLP